MTLRLFYSGLFLAVVLALPLLAQSGEPEEPEEKVLGAPAAFGRSAQEEGVLGLEAGIRLRQSPSGDARSIAVVDVEIEVPIVERRERWLLVRYGSLKGWVFVDPRGKPVRDYIPFRTTPDRQALERAVKALGAEPTAAKLGPFALYTDTHDRKLLAFLVRVVEQLPNAYRQRYGLDPGDQAREAVVIFSREADYRAYARQLSVAGGYARGHTTQGLAVVFVERQTAQEVGAILVHELTHLLNRRVLKTAPHPWLEEGMGNDLAYCRIATGSGKLQLGSLGGRSVVVELPIYQVGGTSRVDREVHLKGPIASLSLLKHSRQSDSFLPLTHLLNLGWSEFIDPAALHGRYDHSAFFVRYLLDGEDGGSAAGLRAHLRALAAGAPAGPATLLGHLGREPGELDAGFASWLDDQAVLAPGRVRP